jgi:hypothetical protein
VLPGPEEATEPSTLLVVNPEVVVAIASLVAGTLGVSAATAASRLTRLTVGRISMEVATSENEIKQAVKDLQTATPLTWDDLAKGRTRDSEVREVVAGLVDRLSRLEAVQEGLAVRRQALIETYHRQGLAQSKISFWFSIILGALGFSIIAYSVLTKSEAVSPYISGGVTEAVSALLFAQTNQARKLMADFFERLRQDRRLEEALRLTNSIESAELRSSLQALVAMELIGSTQSPGILPGFRPARIDGGSEAAQ